MISTFWATASEHVFSFTGGVIVGFYLTGRYRVVKREKTDDAPAD